MKSDIEINVQLNYLKEALNNAEQVKNTYAILRIPAQEFIDSNPEFIATLYRTIANNVIEQIKPGDIVVCSKCGHKDSLNNFTLRGNKVICPNCNTTQNIQLIYNKGVVNNGKH